jgi:hypothetical protein
LRNLENPSPKQAGALALARPSDSFLVRLVASLLLLRLVTSGVRLGRPTCVYLTCLERFRVSSLTNPNLQIFIALLQESSAINAFGSSLEARASRALWSLVRPGGKATLALNGRNLVAAAANRLLKRKDSQLDQPVNQHTNPCQRESHAHTDHHQRPDSMKKPVRSAALLNELTHGS